MVILPDHPRNMDVTARRSGLFHPLASDQNTVCEVDPQGGIAEHRTSDPWRAWDLAETLLGASYPG
jgi:hypothetical protein